MSTFRQSITQLSTDQKQKLVNALLQCKNMADRQSRDTLVRELHNDIKTNIQRNDSDRVDVINIVSTALAYGKGLEELIKLVDLYEGNSFGMQAVNEVYLRAQLISIAQEARIDPRIFAFIFSGWQVLPPDEDLPFDSPEIFVEILWELNGPIRRWHLLLEFVGRLSRQIKQTESLVKILDQLQKWAEHAFKIFGDELEFATLDEIYIAVDQQKAQIDEGPVYLTVKIKPDFIDPKHIVSKVYKVQTCFWRDNKQDPLYRAGDAPAIALEDVPEVIYQTLEGEMKKSGRKPIIEFLLPNELLLCDVDQWEYKAKGIEGLRFGMEYQILVRSLGRNEQWAIQSDWRDKWETFKRYGDQHCLIDAFWLCACEEADWQLFQSHAQHNCIDYMHWLPTTDEKWHLVLHSKLKSAKTVTCLGMTFSPLEKSNMINRLITVVLGSGIPIALWLRPSPYSNEPPTKIHTRIQKIFGDQPLETLPQKLQQAREQSVYDRELDISNHLTLLWDDQDRIPAFDEKKRRTKNANRLRAPQPSRPGRRAS